MKNNNLNKNLKPVDDTKSSGNILKFVVIILFAVICLIMVFYKDKDFFNFFKTDNTNHQAEVQTDFAPYMRDFQKKIKSNWQPPKNNTSQTVVLLITIDKNGYVVRNVVKKSSENAEVDKAAIDAVKKSEPFDALPSFYNGNTVDIEFTFVYNILNAK
ncbi:MAG: TonB C-terminal domain-containing protein [Candidatus Gastranaerophilales bacterium]|nr:TonB C-terminal domain-containing protein [Candidatus Gastranaerophilales bacterium]